MWTAVNKMWAAAAVLGVLDPNNNSSNGNADKRYVNTNLVVFEDRDCFLNEHLPPDGILNKTLVMAYTKLLRFILVLFLLTKKIE